MKLFQAVNIMNYLVRLTILTANIIEGPQLLAHSSLSTEISKGYVQEIFSFQ